MLLPTETGSSPPDDDPGKSPTRDGRPFTLGKRIALGGMAEVLLAVQRSSMGFEKLVVIKRMLPQFLEDGEFVQMFLDEARLASRLRHPNIVSIFDVHRDEETFTIAMEYLQGEDLRTLVRVQRNGAIQIPIPITLHIVSKVAEALHCAHTATDERGHPLRIVHRDVAPSNVIVTFDGQVKLIDFGVAKASAHSTYTQPGTMKGKYPYSSPEQIQGAELDARSDVFGLGIVLHEMLTGRRLFKGDGPAATLRSVLADPIPVPSTINPKVPHQLDPIVMRALERDRNSRTPSAEALRKELSIVLAEMMTKVTPRDLALWLRATFPRSLEKRIDLEKATIAAVRGRAVQGGSADGPSPLPPPVTGAFTGLPAPAARTRPSAPVDSSSSLGSPPPRPIVLTSPHSAWRTPLIVLAIAVLAVVLTLAAYWLGHAARSERAPEIGASP